MFSQMIDDNGLALLRAIADQPGFTLPVLPHGDPVRKVVERCHRWRLIQQDEGGAWTLTEEGRDVLARNSPDHAHLAQAEQPVLQVEQAEERTGLTTRTLGELRGAGLVEEVEPGVWAMTPAGREVIDHLGMVATRRAG
jgi:hypothetical protein